MKNEIKKALSLFFAAARFVAANRKLAVYASFFALTGGIFNLIRNVKGYLQYLEFYNPFWNGFSLSSVFSLSKWLWVIGTSLREAVSLGGLLGDLAYLSSANLISIGALLAALFFSARLKDLFKNNDFAWQAAFYSFGGSLVFLPLYAVFSRLLPIRPLALILAVAESVSLSVFLVVLLTFFEAVFLMLTKFKVFGETYDRDRVFAAASSIFRSLFIFNLIWAVLNPLNFSGLFSLPAFLGYLASSTAQYAWLSAVIWWVQKSLVVLFLLFSAVFVFVPLTLCFEPGIGLKAAMRKGLSIFKEAKLSIVLLFLGGIILQVVADFAATFLSQAAAIFGFGSLISSGLKDIFGPVAYAFALLVFLVAAMRFLKERHYAGSGNAQGSVGRVEVEPEFPSKQGVVE